MSLNIASAYREAFQKLPIRLVQLGCFGIELFPLDKLPEAQRGYSGDGWKDGWLVVGSLISLGDPIIVDTSDPNLPVTTDMHGTGQWVPQPVAKTFEQFGNAMAIYSILSQGRESPKALVSRPISPDEHEEFVRNIRNVVGSECAGFWISQVNWESDEERNY